MRHPPKMVWDYDYQDVCPAGDRFHSGQRCAIVEELPSDEAGLARYRVRFADGVECEALEPEVTRPVRPRPA